ncbi:MAG TPA: hypothetical protein VH741_10335, partial [Candidatus Limnocylindrales bacterium]
GLPAQLRTGDVLALKVSVRTAQCSVHRDGSFAMWYDTSNAFYQSYFTMTISGQARAIYLRSNGSGSCGASGTPGVSSLFLSTVPWVSGAAKCVRKYPPRYGNPPVILGGNTGSPPPTLWTMTITEFGEIQPDPILPSQLVE